MNSVILMKLTITAMVAAVAVVSGCNAPQDDTVTDAGCGVLMPLQPFYDSTGHDNYHDDIYNAPLYVDYYTDMREGGNNQTYGIVAIGGREWMTENLNYRHSSWAQYDDDIFEYDHKGSWCYYDDPDDCDKYGRLYTFEAAIEACPADDGWRLPDNADWETLIDAAGGLATAGRKLKSDTGWYFYPNGTAGTNDYKFSALPGGYRLSGGGIFEEEAFNGYWWSATLSTSILLYHSYYWSMEYRYDKVDIWDIGLWNTGYSVRCVRDIKSSIKEPPRRVGGF
ncbi:MAG: hypothetical protein LBI42_00290 [Chitinispirillales bacterium]|nr:hypothetical protein [Chitinispirillales bacterium]